MLGAPMYTLKNALMYAHTHIHMHIQHTNMRMKHTAVFTLQWLPDAPGTPAAHTLMHAHTHNQANTTQTCECTHIHSISLHTAVFTMQWLPGSHSSMLGAPM